MKAFSNFLPNESFPSDTLVLKNILIATDLSQSSMRALAYALPLAERFDAKLHFLYVCDPHVPQFFSEPELTAKVRLEVEWRSGRKVAPNECEMRTGTPWKEITSAAAEMNADLIVMGTHGRTGFTHFILGSTAEKVLRHARCPVVVVRDAVEEQTLAQKILVPVDFSKCAEDGVRYAARFANAIGADLKLMHVIAPPDFLAIDGYVGGPGLMQVVEAESGEAENNLNNLISRLPLKNASAEAKVEIGQPVEKLVEMTANGEVDLVVTSTHGDSAFRHVLLGSVAEELVRRAHCPVLVVPSRKSHAAHRTITWQDSFELVGSRAMAFAGGA